MSLTTGLIAIKGDYTRQLSEVFAFFELVDKGKDQILTSWDQASEIMNDEFTNPQDHTQRRIAWYDNGWTIIEDLSFILCGDAESLVAISAHFSTPVFSLLTQGTSGVYGFSYVNGQDLRSFLIDDGKVTEDIGTPLAAEANFNINETAFYDDVHGVASQLGISWDNAERINRFIVKQLDNSEELNREIESISRNNDTPAHKASKPWWKFW